MTYNLKSFLYFLEYGWEKRKTLIYLIEISLLYRKTNTEKNIVKYYFDFFK